MWKFLCASRFCLFSMHKSSLFLNGCVLSGKALLLSNCSCYVGRGLRVKLGSVPQWNTSGGQVVALHDGTNLFIKCKPRSSV